MTYYNEIFLHSSALINGNRHDNVIKKFGNVLDLLFLPYTKNNYLTWKGGIDLTIDPQDKDEKISLGLILLLQIIYDHEICKK